MNENPTFILQPSLKKHLATYFFTALANLILIGVSIFAYAEFETGYLVLACTVPTIIGLILNLLYVIWYTRAFKIRVDRDDLEFTHGVFNKTVESIEMHRIKDFVKKQSLIDQLLGLAKVIVHSTDHTTPVKIFDGLRVDEAQIMMKFLRRFSSDSLIKHYINKGREIPQSLVGAQSYQNQKKEGQSEP